VQIFAGRVGTMKRNQLDSKATKHCSFAVVEKNNLAVMDASLYRKLLYSTAGNHVN
jgi:hypothetical protein